MIQLDADGRLQLGELCLNEFGLTVAFAVVLGEDLVRLLMSFFGDEPSGRLRDQEDEGDLEERGDHL